MQRITLFGLSSCSEYIKFHCILKAIVDLYPNSLVLKNNNVIKVNRTFCTISSLHATDISISSYDSLVILLKHHFKNGRIETAPLVLFMSGSASQVGKSSVCLALLATLQNYGYPSNDLAYIKPATQCEKSTLVSEYCQQQGISAIGVGPIVYYPGFTREFLTAEASPEPYLEKVTTTLIKLSKNKRIVLVDGVGYPAVGSIVGLSNATIAKAIGARVILVGKAGVGDAVDSYNLNASYFEMHGVPVLGAIFNRISTLGYYNIEACSTYVNAYFRQNKPSQMPYGYLPDLKEPLTVANLPTFIAAFEKAIDLQRLLDDAQKRDERVPKRASLKRSRDTSSLRTVRKRAEVEAELAAGGVEVSA